ncbi:MAG: hypothetical protein ACRC7V_08350 [Lachnospiraceae bacterium]
MKILKSISLFCIYPILMFSLGVFSHIKYLEFFYPGKNQERNVEFINDTYENEELTSEVDALEVVKNKTILTCETSFEITEYDITTKNKVVNAQGLPEKYFGMDREQFAESLSNYELRPSLEDMEKGFVSLSVDYFSDNLVRITKNYNKEELEKGYYLIVKDNKIVVMEFDLETIYMETHIELNHLPTQIQQEIIDMKYIETIEKVYDFLESYSS